MDIYLYVDRDSLVHRLDPRAKMIALLGVLLLSLATDHPVVPGIMLAAMFLTTALAGTWRALRRVRMLLVILSSFSLLSWSFFARGTTPLWGPIEVEALLYGLGTAMKLSCAVVASTLFLATTRNEEIATGMIRLGLPFNVAFVFSTSLRLVPTFVGTGATIVQAQKSRGLDIDTGNILQRMRKYLPLVVPIFVGAIRSTNQLSMALESKGFGARPTRSSYLVLRMRPADWGVMLLGCVLVAGFILVRFGGYGKIPGLIR